MDVLVELNDLQIIKKNEDSPDEPFLWSGVRGHGWDDNEPSQP